MKSIYRVLRPIYGVHNRLTERTIRYTIGKLENNLTLLDDTRPIRPRTARTVENIAAVNETFGSNKTALHVIQPVKQWIYCVVVSVSNLSLVSDRCIGLQDRVISHLWTFILFLDLYLLPISINASILEKKTESGIYVLQFCIILIL